MELPPISVDDGCRFAFARMQIMEKQGADCRSYLSYLYDEHSSWAAPRPWHQMLLSYMVDLRCVAQDRKRSLHRLFNAEAAMHRNPDSDSDFSDEEEEKVMRSRNHGVTGKRKLGMRTLSNVCVCVCVSMYVCFPSGFFGPES